MKVRSVPKSECYIPLVEIAKEQPVFEFENIRGTLAGFYTPDFMAAVSVPGMHLHFLSDDLAHGGHLCRRCIPSNWLCRRRLTTSIGTSAGTCATILSRLRSSLIFQ